MENTTFSAVNQPVLTTNSAGFGDFIAFFTTGNPLLGSVIPSGHPMRIYYIISVSHRQLPV
jgi:hypothetical protein